MFGTSLERPSTWAIIAIAALVLFGYKRLPEVTRSVGKSLRIFKAEMKGMNSDDDARQAADTAKPSDTAPAQTPTTAPTPPAVLPSAAPSEPTVEAPPVTPTTPSDQSNAN